MDVRSHTLLSYLLQKKIRTIATVRTIGSTCGTACVTGRRQTLILIERVRYRMLLDTYQLSPFAAHTAAVYYVNAICPTTEDERKEE
jgi:hypothetical protein